MQKDRIIALAGVCQAAVTIQQIARKGNVQNADLTPLLNSVLITTPDSTEEVFGGMANVKQGLALIINQLGNEKDYKDSEQTRYIISMLTMERKVSKGNKHMAKLGERIGQLDRQLEHFSLDSDNMIASLASIYSDVISPIGPKIQVAGSPAILQQPGNQHKVRAVLLAGIRSAVLWRQLGGKRRQMIFNRVDIVNTAKHLLNSITYN